MRLVTPGDMAPSPASQRLLPSEQVIFTVRLHPAALLSRLAAVAGGTVAATWATIAAGFRLPEAVAWILTALLAADLALAVLRWLNGYLVLTDERLLDVRGEHVESVPYESLEDLRLDQTWFARVARYGTLVLRDGRTYDHIPYPWQVYQELIGALFPETAEPDA
jgi:hypothetical protein